MDRLRRIEPDVRVVPVESGSPSPTEIGPASGLHGAVSGAALFGAGWGAAGLCPGPALADLALAPGRSGLFAAAMLAGFGLHVLADPTTRSSFETHLARRKQA